MPRLKPDVPRVRAPPPAPIPYRLLKAAPWFIDVRELQSFNPSDVWEHFRTVFPVLAVYRSGWIASSEIATVPTFLDAEEWNSAWSEWRVTVEVLGRLLRWPESVMDVSNILVPLTHKLWPQEPWSEWLPEDQKGTVPRAIVPHLRRTACLCHGFYLGGCSPRGVWEAVSLPNRIAT